MYPPVDYPVTNDDRALSETGDITYAALLERHDAQQAITDAMIQSACVSMEAAHQLPSATRPRLLNHTVPSAPIFQRLLGAIR